MKLLQQYHTLSTKNVQCVHSVIGHPNISNDDKQNTAHVKMTCINKHNHYHETHEHDKHSNLFCLLHSSNKLQTKSRNSYATFSTII